MNRSTSQVLLGATVVLLLVGVATASGLWTKRLTDAATTGKAQAEAGAKSLAAQDATAALSQFAAATRTFASAKRSLGPQWVGAAVLAIPWAGRQYTAAETLLQIGLDGSRAGTELSKALQLSPTSPGKADSAGRFVSLLTSGRRNIEDALAALTDASEHAAVLSPDGLVPPLAKATRSVKAALAAATPFLGRSNSLLQLESYLLSGEHRILVVSQDGAELRPTGGFPGTFGIIDVGATGIRLESYENVYALPDPPGIVPPPQGALMTNDFSFRDAGWWIDFPTSARAMLGFWRTYQQPQVDGIVAIDTVAMKDLLAAIGPVGVPSYGETFTAANVLERLLYLVEVRDTHKANRKGVLTALAAALENRVLAASPTDLGKSALALGKAADEKHVQMYFTDSHAEAAVDALGWSGRVSLPVGTTDLVGVSNAMTQAGKVNVAVNKSVDYTVRLKSDHSAETTLVLSYSNTGPFPLPIPGVFRDWLRVYRAAGTVFPKGTPDGTPTVTTVEFGLPAEVRTFTLFRHQSGIQTLVAQVPQALRLDRSAAANGATYYRLHFIRQDDLTDIPLTVTVSAPPGSHVTGASAQLTASGSPLPVTVAGDRARMSVPLSGDLDLEVKFAPN